MNCIFVASYFGPYYSNFVASVLAFHDCMVNRGHEMSYVFPKEVEGFEWISNLLSKSKKVYFIPYRGNSLKDVFTLRKIFRNEKIDLVYSRMCGWDFAAHLAAPRTPIVWHMDMFVNLNTFSHRLKNWCKFHMLGFGKTYHIGVSNAVADVINSLKPAHKCIGIPNALDFMRLPEETVRPFQTKPYKLLLFGWAPLVKGLDTVLDACSLMEQCNKPIELIVSAQKMTYQYICDKYHGTTPIWLKLVPPTENVAFLYSKVDIMISASRSEGFSYCLAEALYSGLPVVFSDIPGTSWAAEFQGTYQFKVADHVDLYRAINLCIAAGINHEQQAFNRALLEQKYSMNNWTKQVANYLEEILRGDGF